MAGVYPVPTTRTSDLLNQTRLLAQLQSDELEILRYQSQISTGRRLAAPSDDAPAALRAQSLQRLLELKAQAQTNLRASQSYLDATDTAVADVATTLSSIRATALGVSDSSSSDAAREAAATEVRRAIEQLVSVGNQNFRGRYLFAGSRTTTVPFSLDGNLVTYHGNEGSISSFVDLALEQATNVSGSEIFGAFSPGVRGTVDLNPILTRDTLLTDLQGGQGITPGSIAISDGTRTSVIDITSAETIGDVADLIAANPPAGRSIIARVTTTGLVLDIDDAGGGNLTVREVGAGTTAAELGILNTLGTGTGPITGRDLDPILRLTTRLADILGARAAAYIDSPGRNNNLILEANQLGAAENGVTLQFVDDGLLQAAPGLNPGNEFATYQASATAARAALALSGFGNNLILTAASTGTSLNDVRIELADAGAIGNAATADYNTVTKTLTLGIDSTGATDVQALLDAIAAEGTFTASYDASDPNDGGFNAAALVQTGDIGVVSGNTGNSGGDANTIFVHIDPGATTANQVIAALTANATISARFTARLDPRDGATIASTGNGFVDLDAGATTAGGSGEPLDLTSGLLVHNGGQAYTLDLSGAVTVEDLLNALNGSPASLAADIDPAGDRIRIRSRLSGADFQIGENGGTTATQLGVRSLTHDTNLADLNHGRGVSTAAGIDFSIQRRDGTVLDIDLDGASTIGDILDLINNRADNQDPATRVVARLAQSGNGIELIDGNATPTATLQVTRSFQSFAAIDLGLVAQGETTTSAASTSPDTITAGDVNPLEVAGVFNSLGRLHDALLANDVPAIERALALLDQDFDRVNAARAEVGARGQSLETLHGRLEDENIQLQGSLSDEIDTDLAEAISNLTARQAALEASLQLTARTFQLSLLDFL
ncbi:MAG: flagellin [Pirellulaceae bacterium]|nr:flagellin [Pirellulaceae bacterium]